jgi:NADPH:quinone reductase-like Zn-dependent oxidoreductase
VAGELSEGQSVLIHGAAGGVGHVAVQLAKSAGARVIGTARGRDAEFLRGLGVDQFIDFETTRFEEVAHGLDVVLDSIGGDVQERSWDVLRPGGILVTLRTAGGIQKKAAAHGVRAKRILVWTDAEHLASINALVASGQLRPAIATVYPLHEARAAQERLAKGPSRGKIVLDVVAGGS